MVRSGWRPNKAFAANRLGSGFEGNLEAGQAGPPSWWCTNNPVFLCACALVGRVKCAKRGIPFDPVIGLNDLSQAYAFP